MAEDFKLSDAHQKGLDLGARLRNGDVDVVEQEHNALINRIRDELKAAPSKAENVIDSLHQGMSETDAEDVASPGHGTMKGYYVYFGPERAVTRTIDTLDEYCKKHSNCDGIGTQPNPYPQYATEGEKANQSPAGQQELNKMLQDLNNSLFYDKDLP